MKFLEAISGSSKVVPLSPSLFGLYIDNLEEWLNSQGGDGIQLGKFVIRLLLYADELILISKSNLGLQEHLCCLELFCRKVGMQVNISKTKVVVFSNKKSITNISSTLKATFWKKLQTTNTLELTSTEI
jgi:hypothetical protein